ncbi:hypothetical protein Daus18300_007388 [Diaporthe australafricana]|uniref:Uncharacterized protein n=1 Tax=Diaporthe australafricana TaxID=127596 RepID=A0ABR3WMZ1_9PEZI
MASLPSQHPYLALHMTDRATTPLISSSSSASSSSPSQTQAQRQSQSQSQHQRQTKRPAATTKPTTFSTSPPSTPSSRSSSPSSSSVDEPPSPATRQATALASLSATALLSYDAAKRLDRGAPLRTMVEYPDGGPVVLHSYMCPMGLALGVPGRNLSSASLHTAAGAVGGSAAGSVNGGAGDGGDDDDAGGGGGGGSGIAAARAAERGGRDGDHRKGRTPTRPLSFALDPAGGDDGGGGGDAEGIDPSDPPMLTSTVVAPRAEDLREARRATGRLERVARVFQTEWVATGRGGGGENLL